MDAAALISMMQEAAKVGVKKLVLSSDGSAIVEFGHDTHSQIALEASRPFVEAADRTLDEPMPSDEELLLYSTPLKPGPQEPEQPEVN